MKLSVAKVVSKGENVEIKIIANFVILFRLELARKLELQNNSGYVGPSKPAF